MNSSDDLAGPDYELLWKRLRALFRDEAAFGLKESARLLDEGDIARLAGNFYQLQMLVNAVSNMDNMLQLASTLRADG